MIKNEKQYRITKAQVRRFEDALAELATQERPSNITPRLWEAQRQAAESQVEELAGRVEAYEQLYMGRSKEVILNAVEDLPKALIRARIAAGMTQEGLARRLGVSHSKCNATKRPNTKARASPGFESRSGARTEDAEGSTAGPQRIAS